MFRSKTQTTQRRTALLAGASLWAASLAAGLAVIAPTAALAANECGPTDGVAGTPDTISCPNVAYPDGITYTSNGALTVNLQSGITSLGTGTNNIGGLMLTAGAAADSLTATTITALSTSSSTGTRAPVVIDMVTQAGDITLTTGGTVGGVAAVVQYGVRAVSSGAGDITITGGGNIQTGTSASDPGIAGILATSVGGDIDISLTGSATGRQYGLRASTSGAGTLTFEGGAGTGSGTSGGIAAIDVTTGTGLLTLNLNRGANASAINAIGVRTNTGGGDAVISVTGGTVSAGNNNSADSGTTNVAVFELNMAGGTTTITQNQANASNAIGGSGTRLWVHDAIRANGSGEVVFNNLSGRVFGQMEFSGFDGDVTFTNAGEWTVRGPSNFTSGDTAITNQAGGVFILGSRDPRNQTSGVLSDDYTSLTFGGGASTLTNEGAIIVSVAGNPSVLHAQTTELIGLQTFNNSGDILLGGADEDPGAGTDGYIDDILIAHDIDFVASEGSRFLMDADLGVGAGQANCDRTADGDLPAADCVDFSGATVSGLTLINITDRVPGDRGAFTPGGIVLVDITGGSASGENFALDPTTASYRDINGGVIDKGMIAYSLAYDADTQQLKLFGLPNDSALQAPLLVQTADDIWRASAGSWFERQVEMRDGPLDGAGGGVWVRTSFNRIDREVVQSVTGGGNTFDWTNDHETDFATLTLGADLNHAGAGDLTVVAGAMLGYALSETAFDFSPNTMEMDGIQAGAYVGALFGEAFVNALFNASRLEMNADIPSLNLVPAGTLTSTTFQSMGAQLEAGWRWRSGPVAVEPLLTVSHVVTTADDMLIAANDPIREGLTITFPDQTSTRAGLGARASMETDFEGLRTLFNVTGRVWRDFDSETSAVMTSTGPDATLSHDMDGEFYDLAAGAVLSNEAGSVSGFINLGGTWGPDYQAAKASAGFRYQW